MGLWKHKLFVDPVKKSTCKVWHETKAKEKVVECEKVDGNDSHKFYQIELTAHKSLKSSRWHFIVFHILAPGNIFLGVKIGFTLVTFIHWIFDYLKGEKEIEKSVIYLALKQLKVDGTEE